MRLKIFATALFCFVLFVSSAQIDGDNIFNDEMVHEVRITFNTDNYWDTLEYNYSQYLNFGADKQYMLSYAEIDGQLVDSIGFRQKGFYSNWGAGDSFKKPFKIDFNEFVPGQRFDGLKKLNLQNGFQDPTMMRDVMSYKFLREQGIKAPRTSFARVFLNDQYWGLYILVEQIDERFLDLHFDDNDGNLFKCINNTNLDWQGNSIDQYLDEFELKTNEAENDWSNFLDFVQTANLSPENFDENIAVHFNMQEYLKILAADVMMNNWDSYYDHGRNFYLYHDLQSNRIHWIPWDYNLSFSVRSTSVEIDYSDDFIEPKPLVINVLNSEEYFDEYLNAFCEIINSAFVTDQFESDIEIYQNLISPYLDADTNKFFTFEEFETALFEDISVEIEFEEFYFEQQHKGLAPYLNERSEEVLAELESLGFSCSAVSISEEPKSSLKVWPNPANDQLHVELPFAPNYFKCIDSLGKEVILECTPFSESMTFDLSNLTPGVYFILVADKKEKSSFRFVRK